MDFGKIAYDLATSYQETDHLKNYIIPRHSSISSRLREGPFKGYGMGDSIFQGTGTSNVNYSISYTLGGKLYTLLGGSGNGWSPQNVAVGGTTIAQVLAYCAHTLNNSYDVSKGIAFTLPYWIIMTGRNDCNLLDIKTFSRLYRTAVRMGIRAGIDVICCTEPPYINMSTRQIDDPNYPEFADEIRRISAQEGASLVDAHGEWLYLQKNGKDLATLTADGTHPVDEGHGIIASMLNQCIVGISSPGQKRSPGETERLSKYVLSQYNTSATSSANVIAVTGLTTPTTSRAQQTGTNDAIEIAAGGYADFKIPQQGGAEYVLITVIQKNSGQGYVKVQSPVGYAIGTVEGYSGVGPATREFTYIVQGTPNPSYPTSGTIRVLAYDNPVIVTGIHVVCTAPLVKHDTVRGTEVGTWSDVTGQSLTWRSSSTIGDTLTIDWFGTDLVLDVERWTDRGKIGYSTDGVTPAASPFDCYLNASPLTSPLLVASGLAKGWHKTVLTVVAKNASSSGNKIAVRNARICTSVGVDGRVIAMVETGVTVFTPDGQNQARAQAGVPTVNVGSVTNTTKGIIEAMFG